MKTSTTTVQSPCIRKCCLDEDDICLGCFRSLDEITAWGMASDDHKLDILKKTAVRRTVHTARYGGKGY